MRLVEGTSVVLTFGLAYKNTSKIRLSCVCITLRASNQIFRRLQKILIMIIRSDNVRFLKCMNKWCKWRFPCITAAACYTITVLKAVSFLRAV